MPREPSGVFVAGRVYRAFWMPQSADRGHSRRPANASTPRIRRRAVARDDVGRHAHPGGARSLPATQNVASTSRASPLDLEPVGVLYWLSWRPPGVSPRVSSKQFLDLNSRDLEELGQLITVYLASAPSIDCEPPKSVRRRFGLARLVGVAEPGRDLAWGMQDES